MFDGPLKIPEALAIARQIIRGLEATARRTFGGAWI